MGDRAARARAGPRRASPRPTTTSRCSPPSPYPGRGGDGRALARGRATSSTSPRTATPSAHDATARWLDAIGLPYDELYCSYDKIARCRRDRDRRADRRRAGQPARSAATRVSTAATLVHPWNRTLCEAESVICAPRLARRCAAARADPGAVAHEGAARLPPTTCAPACPRSSPSARSPTGGAPSASRACSTRRSTSSSTTTGSAATVEGIENVPADRRRAAGLQPRRRAAARRGDDRQGDQGGAPAPAAAAPHGRALLQGLSGLQHAACRRSAACPPTRPTCTGCCTTRSSSCSSSPRAARAPRSSTRTATSCAASAAAASSRRRCAPARRSCRWRSSAPRRRCRSSPTSAPLQRLTGLIYFPITPTFPHFGLLGFGGYLPAKFRIRFLEPIPTDELRRGAVGGHAAWCRRSPRRSARGSRRSSSTCSRKRALGVVRMTSQARSSSPGCRPTGAAGSRRRSSATPTVEAIIGVDPKDPTCELERTEYVRVGTQHALLRRIVQAARDRHRRRLAAGRSTRRRPRRATPTRRT